MATRALDSNGDWTFGQGKQNYLIGAKEVQQNAVTRIKSFKNDWFSDTEQCSDWFNILGNTNNENIIISEVIRVLRGTFGIRQIIDVKVISNFDRQATIKIICNTIFDTEFENLIGIDPGAKT